MQDPLNPESYMYKIKLKIQEVRYSDIQTPFSGAYLKSHFFILQIMWF